MPARSPIRRDAIVELFREQGRPMHVGELGSRLGLEAHDRSALRDAIDELVFAGVLRQLAGQRYRLSPDAVLSETRLVEGVIQLNPRGFGFVALGAADGDLFVPAEAIGGAMHGDRVRARVVSRSRRGLEGAVDEVVERRVERVVGVLRVAGKSSWLEPDDSRIRGPIVLTGNAVTEAPESARSRKARPTARRKGADGHAAVVRITRYPALADEHPEGELVAELGLPGDPAVEVAKILLVHSVEEEHPAEAIAEAKALPLELSPALRAAREDLTDIPFVTIDPEDARDHDDAVWAERHDEGGYRVWVAIADVSHYVTPGSALDRAALARGCSIYLPDRAIPMLPPELSSCLCSLLPGELRPCLCVVVDLKPTGAVAETQVVEGVMRSRARLTYGGVARALGLTAEPARSPEAEERRGELDLMWEIATLLRRRRLRRGALDFDLPDVRVALDPKSGLPTGVSQRAGDPGVRKAYRLVEELMLLANECCAELLVRAERPTIFRVHAPPDVERLDRFASLLEELDIDVGAESLDEVAADPKRLAKLLERLRAHPSRSVLHSLLLRAMAQAAYDTVNIGHFGLASGAYLHFSSPIRRYPDLVVHRVLRAALRREPDATVVELPTALPPAGTSTRAPVRSSRATGRRVSAGGSARSASASAKAGPGAATAARAKTAQATPSAPGTETDSPLRIAARLASDRERSAMEVERQIVDLYRALYMRGRIGEQFAGTISSVTPSGVFVQIEEPFVDVLVTMEALGPDSYELDEDGLRIVAARSGERLMLGDAMTVAIEDVSLTRRSVYGRRVRERRPQRERPTRGRGRRRS